MSSVEVLRMGGWVFYIGDGYDKLEKHKCGKWMYFFTDQIEAMKICKLAIDSKVCYLCKCADLAEQGTVRGPICFYSNVDDIENHKYILAFMIKLGLIKKTKTGRLTDISFKLDSQTRAGEYGADFEGKIKLSQFVDLYTLKWIYPEK